MEIKFTEEEFIKFLDNLILIDTWRCTLWTGSKHLSWSSLHDLKKFLDKHPNIHIVMIFSRYYSLPICVSFRLLIEHNVYILKDF